MSLRCLFGFHRWKITSIDKYEKYKLHAQCERCKEEKILYSVKIK